MTTRVSIGLRLAIAISLVAALVWSWSASPDAPPGLPALVVDAVPGECAPEPRSTIDARTDESEPRAITASAAPNSALAGIVRDSLGEPVRLFSIVVTGSAALTFADSEGRFEIHGVHDGVRLTVRAPGFVNSTLDVPANVRHVELTLPREALIHGQAMTMEGDAVPGLVLECVATDGSERVLARSTTDRLGAYRLTPTSAGVYHVRAAGEAGDTVVCRSLVPLHHEVRIANAVTVHCVVRMDGQPVVDARLRMHVGSLDREAKTDGAGAVAWTGVPRGSYRVDVTAAGCQAREVVVDARLPISGRVEVAIEVAPRAQ